MSVSFRFMLAAPSTYNFTFFCTTMKERKKKNAFSYLLSRGQCKGAICRLHLHIHVVEVVFRAYDNKNVKACFYPAIWISSRWLPTPRVGDWSCSSFRGLTRPKWRQGCRSARMRPQPTIRHLRSRIYIRQSRHRWNEPSRRLLWSGRTCVIEVNKHNN